MCALLEAFNKIGCRLENTFAQIFSSRTGLTVIVRIFNALPGEGACMILFRAKNTAGTGYIQLMADAAILLFVDFQPGGHSLAAVI